MTTLGVWGPNARAIVQSLTTADMSHEGFPFGSCRVIEMDRFAFSRRASPTSENSAGVVPAHRAGSEVVGHGLQAGQSHGLIPVGVGVYGTGGRLEKGYRAYGAELDAEYNIVEAGMALKKVKDADFVGKEAFLQQREEEPMALMCTLSVTDHHSASGEKRYMLGMEPILTTDGAPIADKHGRRSFVTSAGSAPSLQRLPSVPPRCSIPPTNGF